MLCVVEALDVVARWCVIGAPAHLKSGCMNEKAPVHMAHHVHCSGNVLVEFWIWQILRHVVEEIDVPEGPSGEIFGLRSDLKLLKI